MEEKRKVKKYIIRTQTRAGKHCLQGSSTSFITMQCYRSSTVIKLTLTVVPQAVYRYSSRSRQSRRNLEDKSKTNEVINIQFNV